MIIVFKTPIYHLFLSFKHDERFVYVTSRVCKTKKISFSIFEQEFWRYLIVDILQINYRNFWYIIFRSNNHV